jgi:hypothetical protein
MLLMTCLVAVGLVGGCFIHSLAHPNLLRAEIPIKGICMDDR